MRDALFDLCRRFADAHVDSSGVAVTPVPGITLVRALHPGDLQAAIARPLVAMLLQGRKSVTTGLAIAACRSPGCRARTRVMPGTGVTATPLLST